MVNTKQFQELVEKHSRIVAELNEVKALKERSTDAIEGAETELYSLEVDTDRRKQLLVKIEDEKRTMKACEAELKVLSKQSFELRKQIQGVFIEMLKKRYREVKQKENDRKNRLRDVKQADKHLVEEIGDLQELRGQLGITMNMVNIANESNEIYFPITKMQELRKRWKL